MPSILITNAYSARNRGDAGIILAMLADLRAAPQFRDAFFTVSTQDYPDDMGRYPCTVVPSFHSIKNRFSSRSILSCLCFLLLLLPVSLIWVVLYRISGRNLPLGGQFGILMRSYTAADLIVAAGGGYLYTTSSRHGAVVLAIQIYSFCLGFLLGKPVYLYSQSIGPFGHPFHAALIRWALRKVRLVQLREVHSLRLVESWHLPTPVRLTVDAGFLTPAEPNTLPVPGCSGRTKVGVTVRRWFREERGQAAFEETMRSFLRWLIEEQNASLFFLPQVTVSRKKDDDLVIARSLADSLPHTYVVDSDVSAPQLKGWCGRMDFMVATRLHSAIFAAAMFVPCLSIAYQPKALGIMEQLDLSNFSLPIEGLTLARMQDTYRRLIKEGEAIRTHLRERIPELCRKAQQNGRMISEDYSQWEGARQPAAPPYSE